MGRLLRSLTRRLRSRLDERDRQVRAPPKKLLDGTLPTLDPGGIRPEGLDHPEQQLGVDPAATGPEKVIDGGSGDPSERKRVVEGKSVSVRVDIGGGGIIEKK